MQCATELEPQETEPTPDNPMILDERRQRVIAGVKSLQPDFREIIVLFDLEGHSYEAIAAMLEIPLGTVRSRLHRARASLRATLEKLL
jgi:RNA polymerase sigma-70 factor (ECF subfamily)